MGVGRRGRMVEEGERRRVAGRVDGDEMGEAGGQRGIVFERGPRAQGEAADALLERARTVGRMGHDRQHPLAGGDEIRE